MIFQNFSKLQAENATSDLFSAKINVFDGKNEFYKQIFNDFEKIPLEILSLSGQSGKIRVRVGTGQKDLQNFRVGFGSGNLPLYIGSGQFRVG